MTTEIVSSWTDSGDLADMHLIDDKVVFSISGIDYAVDIDDVVMKIEKHQTKQKEEE